MMKESLHIQHGESMTLVEHPHFTAHLPFRWLQAESSDGIELRNQMLPEQLFIHLMPLPQQLDEQLMRMVRSELIESQRRAAARLTKGAVQIDEPTLTEPAGRVESRMFGRHPGEPLRVAFLVRVTPTIAVTVSLYRYTHEDLGTPFDVYAGTIFDFLALR